VLIVWIYHGGKPTKMMENYLLYKMCLNGQPGVKPLNSSLFRQVFMSKYGNVKIFKIMKASKRSKEWIANRDNRVCEAPALGTTLGSTHRRSRR
jgi:dolichyl-diphosphooligosaccharide--protein glycosyltransferase